MPATRSEGWAPPRRIGPTVVSLRSLARASCLIVRPEALKASARMVLFERRRPGDRAEVAVGSTLSESQVQPQATETLSLLSRVWASSVRAEKLHVPGAGKALRRGGSAQLRPRGRERLSFPCDLYKREPQVSRPLGRASNASR